MHAVATLTKITGRPAPFDFDADWRDTRLELAKACLEAEIIVDGDTYLARLREQGRAY